MINVKLLIAPTVPLSPHDPIRRLHNHYLCIISYTRNSLTAFSIERYLLCISNRTLCISPAKRRACRIPIIPDDFMCFLFTKIRSECSFLFLLSAKTMDRIHDLSWNETAEKVLWQQMTICFIRRKSLQNYCCSH